MKLLAVDTFDSYFRSWYEKPQVSLVWLWWSSCYTG